MNMDRFEEHAEDRRIRKTKKALRAALVKLLSKKSIDDITIKELTEEADVHRGTFYHHYRDAFDLKEQVEVEIEQELDEMIASVPDSALENGPYPLILKVLCYLEENRDVARMLTSESGGQRLMTKMCEQISVRCMKDSLFGEERRYGSRFCAAGIQGMLVPWVEDGMRTPPKEMAKLLDAVITGGTAEAKGKESVVGA